MAGAALSQGSFPPAVCRLGTASTTVSVRPGVALSSRFAATCRLTGLAQKGGMLPGPRYRASSSSKERDNEVDGHPPIIESNGVRDVTQASWSVSCELRKNAVQGSS